MTTPKLLELPTAMPGVRLRELGPGDAASYKDLMERNRGRLNRFAETVGDLSLGELTRWLSSSRDRDLRMGVRRGHDLVGFVQLSHVSLARGSDLPDSPHVFALGYWIADESEGLGYTTAACRALVDYAQERLGAKEVLSALHPENRQSARVLEKLGFTVYQEREDLVRYRLELHDVDR